MPAPVGSGSFGLPPEVTAVLAPKQGSQQPRDRFVEAFQEPKRDLPGRDTWRRGLLKGRRGPLEALTAVGQPFGSLKSMPSEGVQKRKLSVTAAESARGSTGRVVLVTGTAGFVGFHCAKALKARGDGVLGARQLQ